MSSETAERAAMRLYCFPYAGGSVALFRQWSRAPAGIEIVPESLPGRGTRYNETALDSPAAR